MRRTHAPRSSSLGVILRAFLENKVARKPLVRSRRETPRVHGRAHHLPRHTQTLSALARTRNGAERRSCTSRTLERLRGFISEEKWSFDFLQTHFFARPRVDFQRPPGRFARFAVETRISVSFPLVSKIWATRSRAFWKAARPRRRRLTLSFVQSLDTPTHSLKIHISMEYSNNVHWGHKTRPMRGMPFVTAASRSAKSPPRVS